MSPQKVLTRRELDGMGCHSEGCRHGPASGHGLFIGGRCHPGQPVRALYLNGELLFSCAICERPISAVAVAP